MEVQSIFTSGLQLQRTSSEAVSPIKPMGQRNSARKQTRTANKLRALMKFRRKAVDETDESIEDSGLSRLFKAIMEFVGADMTAE